MFTKASSKAVLFASVALAALAVWLLPAASRPAEAQGASPCVECHRIETPGIVTQWQKGKMGQKGLDCSICHGAEHKDATDYRQAVLPMPDTCQGCHAKQVERFRAGKHALAWTGMLAMPLLSHQPQPIAGPEGFKGCSGCHKIGEKSPEELKAPNFRYGTASCDSCHTRHSFSVAEARDPRACQTCHMGFDHAQWEMWSTSKHGTIWGVEGDSGRGPKCQTCHMRDGDHAVLTAWGFLALRVPEEDPKWWADRVEIMKALGVLDEKGQATERMDAVKQARMARLTKDEWLAERTKTAAICSRCHSAYFVVEQLEAGDDIIREADALVAEAIRTVKGLYDEKLLTKPATWMYAPDLLQFYEARSRAEQELYRMFMEYRMRAFQGAFHNNPDYTHWYGWAALKESLQTIKDEAAGVRAQAAAKVTQEATQKELATLKSQVEKAGVSSQPSPAAARSEQEKIAQEVAQREVAPLKGQLNALASARPIAYGAGALGLIALLVAGIALVLHRKR